MLDRLDEIPGVGRTAAQIIIAEIGLDMSAFPTPGHLASWARLTPRTIQSGARYRRLTRRMPRKKAVIALSRNMPLPVDRFIFRLGGGLSTFPGHHGQVLDSFIPLGEVRVVLRVENRLAHIIAGESGDRIPADPEREQGKLDVPVAAIRAQEQRSLVAGGAQSLSDTSAPKIRLKPVGPFMGCPHFPKSCDHRSLPEAI